MSAFPTPSPVLSDADTLRDMLRALSRIEHAANLDKPAVRALVYRMAHIPQDAALRLDGSVLVMERCRRIRAQNPGPIPAIAGGAA